MNALPRADVPMTAEELRDTLAELIHGHSRRDGSDVDVDLAMSVIEEHVIYRMRQRAAERRVGRRWLAKVTSFGFPRTFSTGPLPRTGGIVEDILSEAVGRHHHVCFTVEITDGGARAVGREVEVQVPADEAMRLGQQMIRIATALLPAPREGEQHNTPIEGEQMM